MPRKEANQQENVPSDKRRRKPRGKGEGSIFYREDRKEWVAQLTLEDGKTRQVYRKKREEAAKELQQMLYEQQQGRLIAKSKQSIRQYLEQWFEQVHRPSIRETTCAKHRILLDKHILPALGHIQVQKLSPQQIQAFYASKLAEGLSPGYVRIMHALLHKALDNAVKWELVSRNVCNAVTAPRPIQHEIQPLTLYQAQQLLETAKGHRLEAIFALAITTGMRKGELLALRWQDVDWAEGCLQVRRSVSYIRRKGFVETAPKTQKSRRKIILPPVVIEVLRGHQLRQKEARLKAGPSWEEHHLVFCGVRGNFLFPTSLVRSFDRLLKDAGLPHVRFHDLRHSAATIMLQMGIHPKVVQELLGHSTISMTMNTYSHVLPSMQQEAMEKVNKLFGG